MELIDLVSELLYNKNCVIIPGFGGFVGNFKSTDFDDNRLLISPTRKKVAFNESLIENDGLLINALQSKKDISYEQAEKEVALFASFLKDRLIKYKNYEFKNLGSLYLNKEDKLIFVAYDGANFHKKSFGLSEVKIKRLSGVIEVTQPKPIPVAAEKAKIVPMPAVPKKRNFYIPQVAASVAILSLFGVMLWQLLQTSAEKAMVEKGTETHAQHETNASIIPDMVGSDSEAIDEVPVVEPEEEIVTNSMDFTDVTDEVIENKGVVEAEVEVEDKAEVLEEPEVLQPIEKKVVETATPTVKSTPKYSAFTETVYYIAVAKNYTPAVETAKRKKLERKEYSLFEVQTESDKVLCIEKFISEKNAKDFLNLVKRYDDREAFIFTNQE